MTHDRSEQIQRRTGLMGWFDRVRYREIYRQAFGLLLVAACAWAAEPGTQRATLGLGLVLIGQVFRIFAAGTIFKNRELATQGAYSLVRHPLYLGNLLILGGFSWASGNWWVAATVALFFLIWYPAAIRYEDGKLERLFGDAWRTWSRDIPAVLPVRLNWSPMTDTSWSAHQSLFRNGELYITVYLAGCAAWLWVNAAH
ncbi:MAG: isoprenylcysteine carboxylmethyltransferase family protein [Xanthomonadales bacterium]|nr:isoprenylcysteine carboxylmethyltransferase family protein [Xanthomonadales bacterium]